MNPPKGGYGRIGDKAVLDEKISECEGHDFQIATTTGGNDIDTVIIEDDGEQVIRALHTGSGDYIIMYNPEYYPKPELPEVTT